MQNRLMQIVEDTQIRKDAGNFTIGDQVDVHQRILEGEKERIQIFTGVVIARKGSRRRETSAVRRIAEREGWGGTFRVNPQKSARAGVKQPGPVPRAKLSYPRARVGRAPRPRDRRVKPGVVAPGTAAPAAEAK